MVQQTREDVTLRVLQSKVIGAETSLEVRDLCIRVIGGAGYRMDNQILHVRPLTRVLYNIALAGIPFALHKV